MSADTLVIGAGPAGIGAGLALGARATVLEVGESVAGLSRTVHLGGAVFDLGGHSFHTPHAHIHRLVHEALPMEEQKRDARCWVSGEIIPYPFQQHFSALSDKALCAVCADGLANADDGAGAGNFDDYLDRRFGSGIADGFLRPYNRKLWGHDLTRLATHWTSQRVAQPIGGARETGSDRKPLQSDAMVAYPARSGFSAIFDALAEKLTDLRLGTKVARIVPDARMLELEAGGTLPWRHIVSTLPLPNLLGIIDGVPDSLIADTRALEALPVTLVLLELEGAAGETPQRLYHAGDDCPAHKIVFNHRSSAWLRGLPQHGIQLEISGARAESDDALITRCAAWLADNGYIRLAALRRTQVIRLALGYPVPTHDHAAIVERARGWLAARDIHIAGRFAEWAYINSDEALARGLTLGQRLLA